MTMACQKIGKKCDNDMSLNRKKRLRKKAGQFEKELNEFNESIDFEIDKISLSKNRVNLLLRTQGNREKLNEFSPKKYSDGERGFQ